MNFDLGNDCAMRMVEEPRPQPTSAMEAPARSLAIAPSSAGSQEVTRFAA
jgi:hypothetical protein